MDFSDFYDRISDMFSKHFTIEEEVQLMKYVEILADANFRCYKANMLVIESRKNACINKSWQKIVDTDKLIADLEWVARNVGEYRVSSKAGINKHISDVKSVKEVTASYSWVTDDIVYSIGEMIDRLSIETIKREDFAKNNRPKHMTEASQKLSDRVEKYLIQKLEEIDEKGFYECVHEQRTYDLEGIVKDLAL